MTPSDITPKTKVPAGAWLACRDHHEKTHERAHSRHHDIHADELREKRAPDVFPMGPAHHVFHEERLKNEQSEAETGGVFNDQIEPRREFESRRNHSGQNDSGRIPCDAVNGAPDTLLPKWLDELLVRAGAGFLVGKHVQGQTQRSHI